MTRFIITLFIALAAAIGILLGFNRLMGDPIDAASVGRWLTLGAIIPAYLWFNPGPFAKLDIRRRRWVLAVTTLALILASWLVNVNAGARTGHSLLLALIPPAVIYALFFLEKSLKRKRKR